MSSFPGAWPPGYRSEPPTALPTGSTAPGAHHILVGFDAEAVAAMAVTRLMDWTDFWSAWLGGTAALFLVWLLLRIRR